MLRMLNSVTSTYIGDRNKGQKLVGHFLKIGHFYKLSIVIPLKMYSKFGQPKWILVSEIGQKMANGRLLFLALRIYTVMVYIDETVNHER